jgi:hypothetical protein
MRFVALKSEAQLDMQTLHQARHRLVGRGARDQSAARNSAGMRHHSLLEAVHPIAVARDQPATNGV